MTTGSACRAVGGGALREKGRPRRPLFLSGAYISAYTCRLAYRAGAAAAYVACFSNCATAGDDAANSNEWPFCRCSSGSRKRHRGEPIGIAPLYPVLVSANSTYESREL